MFSDFGHGFDQSDDIDYNRSYEKIRHKSLENKGIKTPGMLQDELLEVNCLLKECILTGSPCNGNGLNSFANLSPVFNQACQNIRTAWNAAAFSAATDHSLKRYFSFHLTGIREILDTLSQLKGRSGEIALLETGLISLICYQQHYFSNYFNFDALAPTAYLKYLRERLGDSAERLKDWLGELPLSPLLKDCLLAYLVQMEADGVHYTFRSLVYWEELISVLGFPEQTYSPCELDKILTDKLTALNFNHLGFLCYRQQFIRSSIKGIPAKEKLEILHAEIDALKLLPESPQIYDPRWPALASMLSGWLNEEILVAKQVIQLERETAAKALLDKLPLNLSVAHLACLIKLFFDEELLPTSNLADVFRFVARHYRTKRQQVISAGSLSKEYYSTSQKTAAVVHDLLLKMAGRLNRNFFPVWVVISAAIGACSGIH